MSPARAEDGLVLWLRRAAAMLLTALRQTVEVALVRSMVIVIVCQRQRASGRCIRKIIASMMMKSDLLFCHIIHLKVCHLMKRALCCH